MRFDAGMDQKQVVNYAYDTQPTILAENDGQRDRKNNTRPNFYIIYQNAFLSERKLGC